MTDKQTNPELNATPPKAEPKKWEEFAVSVTTHVAVDGPVWIVKHKGGGYVRQAGSFSIAVKSRRLATRFDSFVWASHVAAQLKDTRPVRLWSKAEREAKKWQGATWKAAVPAGIAFTAHTSTAISEEPTDGK